jgi:serine/threonine protein kinase
LVAQDYTIKIADFGYSRMRADNQTMTQVGTVSYSAPESKIPFPLITRVDNWLFTYLSVFEGVRYSDKADVYSLGIVFWELVAGKKVISSIILYIFSKLFII